MSTVLQLTSSLFTTNGESTRLASELVRRLNPRRVIARDLVNDPVPHLTAERFAAFSAEVGTLSPEQRRAVAYSDALIDELRTADTIVLGLPMYNFGVPSQLKAYFDHVARAGVTFRYTSNGPEGLLKGKKAYVVSTRGGNYIGTPADNQTSYVTQFLSFLGITDVQFVYAEGLARGDVVKHSSLSAANESIATLAAGAHSQSATQGVTEQERRIA
jgi:FMN-dependent NADH-azoreductase